MLPPIAPLLSPKHVLRERMKAERARAFAARPDTPKFAAANFLSAISVVPGAIVSLYAPIQTELDTTPLAAALRERGARIALPVVVGRRDPLVFRLVEADAPLLQGPLGVPEPAPEAAEARPDIVVAPLLAFTRDGARLGYGAGHYDRTIRLLRETGDVLVVGYAFGAQGVERLPTGPQDEPLDWIVTEREAIRVAGGASPR